nr:hypothetical protein BaRGS_005327 [Batillaria attramentaria]
MERLVNARLVWILADFPGFRQIFTDGSKSEDGRVGAAAVMDGRYQYVSFAEKSCDVNMTVAREIVVPKDGKHKVAVCIKVVYGDPDPERLVEWLEFSRLVGVDVVQMFYHSVNISQRDPGRNNSGAGKDLG